AGKGSEARDRVAVGHQQFAAVAGELGEAAPLDAQELHELLQAAFDLAVHLVGGEVDEGGRKPRQHGLEAQPLFQRVEEGRALPGLPPGLPPGPDRTVVRPSGRDAMLIHNPLASPDRTGSGGRLTRNRTVAATITGTWARK